MIKLAMGVPMMDYTRMCPRYERAIELLGKRWTGLIIRVLMGGACRFKDLRGQMPELSDRLLSERLKELEAAGLIRRTVYVERPVRIEYELTEKGRDLRPVVDAIQQWAEKHL